jgi:predicted phosphoribosyltransferase
MGPDHFVGRGLRYASRHAAGRALARELRDLVGRPDVVVLGLPRGGVPVASEVAQALGVPLDIFVVRQLLVPAHHELAIGAVASGGIRILDRDLIEALGVSWDEVGTITRNELEELARCERVFRNGRRPLSLRGRVVLLVDDGLATGATMRAAVQAVRTLKPAQVVVAVPVASSSARNDLCTLADRVVCPLVPSALQSVGEWYEDFAATSETEIRGLLGLPNETHNLAVVS